MIFKYNIIIRENKKEAIAAVKKFKAQFESQAGLSEVTSLDVAVAMFQILNRKSFLLIAVLNFS